MSASTPTTGEALAAARVAVGEARVSDPGEHFPYKFKAVQSLLSKDAPMGPEGADDDSASAKDFTSERIAFCSAAYIAAQKAWLLDPSPGNHSAYEAAKDDLVAARRTHRRGRVDADGNPVGGVVATTKAPLAEHQRGPRLRRVGED